MNEVKPTAYMYEDHVFKTEKEAVLFKKEFDRYKHDGLLKHVILPLFTADSISDIYRQEKRIKMTQAEFYELKELKSLNPTEDLIAIIKIVSNFKYKNLQSRFVCGSIENQTEFATLWLKARYERLEELIEIVPDMKWFVVRKLPNTGGNMLKCSEEGLLMYNAIKEAATQFDTEEEAEQWTNPLTEAVQLPVD